MKIKMKRTEPGSVDGFRVIEYVKNQEYDLTSTTGERELARAFVDAGMAVEVLAEPVEAKPVAPKVKK